MCTGNTLNLQWLTDCQYASVAIAIESKLAKQFMNAKGTIHDLLLPALGRIIHQHRRSFSLSQEELAERSGIHRTYISDIEHGVRNVSLRNVSRLAEAFGMPASTLIKLAEREVLTEKQ